MSKVMSGITFLLLAASAVLFSSVSSVAAAEPEVKPPPLLAVAIGRLQEAGGDSAIIDFGAHRRGEKTGGNLRFYSPGEGYYNGGVRSLVVENGIIRARGAGGLVRPDGTRVGVRYEAEFGIDSKSVTIHVEGRNGLQYTLSGVLDPGFVRAGSPPAKDGDRPAGQ